ncbi:MAG: Heme O synthase, protoheme IX farnesyltransferase COX10-CtaB, partial [uncultured Quadrisphaera sp.]
DRHGQHCGSPGRGARAPRRRARPVARALGAAAGLPGPDQAPHHRAAAHDHRADDGAGPARPAPARPGGRHGRRRRARRRVGQRAELLRRPRHRHAHAPHRAASAGHRCGQPARGRGLRPRARRPLGGVARRAGEPALGRAGRCRHRVLRALLHDAAQAPEQAEHRLGRGGRVHARADRVVGGHRLAVLGALGALRGDLPLDAAALLAAVDQVPARLRGRRGADARGGGVAGVGGAAVGGLRVGHGGGDAAARPRRGHRAAVRRGGAGPRGVVRRGVAPAAAPGAVGGQRRRGARDAAVPRVDQLPDAALPRARGRRAAARRVVGLLVAGRARGPALQL